MGRKAATQVVPESPDRQKTSALTATWDAMVLAADPLAIMRDVNTTLSRSMSATTKLAPKGFFSRRRYKVAAKRWGGGKETARVTMTDSPLQEANKLLTELAISLEGAKDKKRVAVVRQVIELLRSPNLNGVAFNDSGVGATDAVMREWLGAVRYKQEERKKLSNLASPRLPPIANRTSSIKTLTGVPTLLPADEAAVGSMLEHGITKWFSPDYDSNTLDQLTGGNALVALGMSLHSRHGWGDAATLGIPRDTMQAFLTALQSGYNPVAYHNARHACDVTHGVWWMLTQQNQLRGVVSSAEKLFAAVVAALIHDVGHDGRNNAYHIATWDEPGTEHALNYSDASPLERHHCAQGFRIMRDTKLLASLAPATRRAVREMIIAMVLATDFAQHGKVMNEFKQMLLAPPPEKAAKGSKDVEVQTSRSRHETGGGAALFCASADTMTPAEQLTVASMVIKVADLSYPTKGFKYAMVWIDRCLEEFCEQGEREKERGLPVGYDVRAIDATCARPSCACALSSHLSSRLFLRVFVDSARQSAPGRPRARSASSPSW